MNTVYNPGAASQQTFLIHAYRRVMDALGGVKGAVPSETIPASYSPDITILNRMWRLPTREPSQATASKQDANPAPKEGFRARVAYLFERLPVEARRARDTTYAFYNGIGSRVAGFKEYVKGAFDSNVPVYRATLAPVAVIARPNLTRSLFYAGLIGLAVAGCGKASTEDVDTAVKAAETKMTEKLKNYVTITGVNNAVENAVKPVRDRTASLEIRMGDKVDKPTDQQRAAAARAAKARAEVEQKYRDGVAAQITALQGAVRDSKSVVDSLNADYTKTKTTIGGLEKAQGETTRALGTLSTRVEETTTRVEGLARDYRAFAAETERRIRALEPKKPDAATQDRPPADVGTPYDPLDIIRAPVVRPPTRSLGIFDRQ